MADPEVHIEEPGNDEMDKTPPEAVSKPTLTPNPSAGPGPKPALAPTNSLPSSSSSRPLYIPQFTAATQIILKKMKGEPSSLSAALSQASRSPSVTASIPSATYEDVKRRLVMGMNTSTQMTMQMPAAPPARPPPVTLPAPLSTVPKSTSSTAGMSAIRKVTAGLTASSKPTPIKTTTTSKVLSSTTVKITKKTKPSSTARTAPTGKRKRPKTEHDSDSDDALSSLSSRSLTSTPSPSTSTLPHPQTFPDPSTPVLLTMTKSGRHVLKPTAYNPAAMDAASKRQRTSSSLGGSLHYGTGGSGGKRTVEQALCRHCSRMHSPASNQIVFCDGCNDGWHQLCHEPWIGEDIVSDDRRGWFCSACVVKRERGAGGGKRGRVVGEQGKKDREREKEKGGGREKESWAGKPAQQKRAYLSTLPQQELVGLLMACLEAHPDLPLFPASHHTSSSSQGHGGEPTAAPRSLFAGTTTEGLFPLADAHPNGQMNFVRKVNGGTGKSAASQSGKGNNQRATTGSSGKGSQKEDSQERGAAAAAANEDDEFDPLAALWPRVGRGMYTRLPPDVEDEMRLVDAGDFEAFSVILYDERGRKVEENGMVV